MKKPLLLNKKIWLLGAWITISMVSAPCFAWGQIGHRLIGEIAFEQLHPAVKKEVLTRLAVLTPYYGRSSFSFSTTWADRLRSHDVTAFTEWHFINQGFSTDGSEVPAYEKQNVVWAISQSIFTENSPHSNALEKALFLEFLIHFVGDVHQPLHCVTRISKAFPHGDAGGNLYPIHYKNMTSLHELWDGAVGLFDDQSEHYHFNAHNIKRFAQDLQKRYPAIEMRNEINQMSPSIWAQESFELAKSHSYGVKQNATPDAHYLKDGQGIAEHRMVLAGYRLACLLNSMIEKDSPCLRYSSPAPAKLEH